ncbi:MAG: OmpA family protein [Caldimonas sp.]
MKASRPFLLASSISVVVLFMAACAAPPVEAPAIPTETAPAEVAVPVAPSPAAPPAAAAFADAVARAGELLLREAQASHGAAHRDLVIDPLIDAATGQQTHATVQMGAQLAGLITRRAPAWDVQTLTRSSLASQPLLLIGTLTPVNSKGARDENADVFRICLALADLKTGKLVAKRADRALGATVDAEPMPLYRDSPTWTLDATTRAYIQSCEAGEAGDAVAPAYLQRLKAAAAINEAMIAYADNKTGDAYKLYGEARGLAAPDDLRVLNGLYTTSWKTGRKKEAAETFDRIVGVGLDARRLPIKLFFTPGTTTLLQSGDLPAQYALWLHEVSTLMAARDTCLRVVGHTSRTGDPTANDVLSQKRAAVIKHSLERQNRKLASRITADGVGSREILIGLGTDDARDALDRRVEFSVVDCR